MLAGFVYVGWARWSSLAYDLWRHSYRQSSVAMAKDGSPGFESLSAIQAPPSPNRLGGVLAFGAGGGHILGMSAKVLSFPTGRMIGAGTKRSAAKVLNGARKVGLDECVVLGYDLNGDIYATSTEGPGDTLWLMEQAKAWLLRGGEDD